MIRHNSLRGYEIIQEDLKIICMNRLIMAVIGILFVILAIWIFNLKRKGKISAADIYNKFYSGSKN